MDFTESAPNNDASECIDPSIHSSQLPIDVTKMKQRRSSANYCSESSSAVSKKEFCKF